MSVPTAKSVSIRVNVRPEVHEAITAHAESRDVSMADVIRQAIREYLKKMGAGAQA